MVIILMNPELEVRMKLSPLRNKLCVLHSVIRVHVYVLSTDTEAHQVQTLRRVQPLHRQVRPPLSLGGELCRYV